MKYKKDFIGIALFLALALALIQPNYSPTQQIFTVIFTYVAIRLCFYVYFQKKNPKKYDEIYNFDWKKGLEEE
jgi:uncharacterized membrane protein